MKKLTMKRLTVMMLAMMFVLPGTLFCGMGAAEASKEKRYMTYSQDAEALGGTMLRAGSGSINETIYYHTRSATPIYSTSPSVPNYISNYTCGVTGGGVTVAYFNKTFTGLIPGHTAGTQIGSTWVWASSSATAIQNMFTSLYTSMGGSMSGVTEIEYIAGLGTYIDSKGYTLSLSNGRSGYNSISSAFKTAIANNIPVTLFVDGFNLFSAGSLKSYESLGYDTFSATKFDSAHVMVAYGYYEVSYFDINNVLIRQDTYVLVNSGFGDLAHMRVSTNCTLDAAYITSVS